LALVPVWAQKFLSTREELWDIHYQYSIEFVPVLAMVLIFFCVKANNRSVQSWVPITFALLASYMTFRDVIQQNVRSNFLSADHYESTIPRKEFESCLSLIPKGEKLSCSSALVPHLVFRNDVRSFPVVDESSYLLISLNGEHLWPLTQSEMQEKLRELQMNGGWEKLYETERIVLFYRLNAQ
jgi:uncharacterized membrane protein